MNLAAVRDAIAHARPFDARTLGLRGDYIAVLSAYPVSARDEDGRLIPYADGDAIASGHLARQGDGFGPLNAQVVRDAEALTRRYMSPGTNYDNVEADPSSSPRHRDDDWIVYYVTNTDSGEVIAAVTADGTALGPAPVEHFRSSAARAATTGGLNSCITETAAYLRQAERD